MAMQMKYKFYLQRDQADRKKKNTLALSDRRRSRRLVQFDSNRILDEQESLYEEHNTVIESSKPISATALSRKDRLLEWKKKRDQLKELEKRNKKPIFKVTRCPSKIEEFKLPVKAPALADVNHKFKLPTNLPKINKAGKRDTRRTSPILTRAALRRQNAIDLDFPVKTIKMRNPRLFENKTNPSIPELVIVPPVEIIEPIRRLSQLNLKTSVKTEQSSVEAINMEYKKDGIYFENLLNSEIERLETRCRKWEQVQLESSETIPSYRYDDIYCAICQTRLLIKDKFEQFRKLTHDERSSQNGVHSDDLQGFWDMIYLQVENLDRKFNEFDRLKAANWVETIPEIKKPERKKVLKKTTVKTSAPSGPSAGLREAIAAARKQKQKELEINKENSPTDVTNVEEQTARTTGKQKKCSIILSLLGSRNKDRSTDSNNESSKEILQFDGRFFQISSPCKTHVTPTRRSLSGRRMENLIKNTVCKSPGLTMLKVTQYARTSSARRNMYLDPEEPIEDTLTTPRRKSERRGKSKLIHDNE